MLSGLYNERTVSPLSSPTAKNYKAAQSLAVTQAPNSPWAQSTWSSPGYQSGVEGAVSSTPVYIHANNQQFLAPPDAMLPTPLAPRPVDYGRPTGATPDKLASRSYEEFLCPDDGDDETAPPMPCDLCLDPVLVSPFLRNTETIILPADVHTALKSRYRSVRIEISAPREVRPPPGGSAAAVPSGSEGTLVCMVVHGNSNVELTHVPAALTLPLHCSSILRLVFYSLNDVHGKVLDLDLPKMIIESAPVVEGTFQVTGTLVLGAVISLQMTSVQQPPLTPAAPPPPPSSSSSSNTQAALAAGEVIDSLTGLVDTAFAQFQLFEPKTNRPLSNAGIPTLSLLNIDTTHLTHIKVVFRRNEAAAEGETVPPKAADSECAAARGTEDDGAMEYSGLIDCCLNDNTQLICLYDRKGVMSPYLFHCLLDKSVTRQKQVGRNRKRNRKRRLRRKASKAAAARQKEGGGGFYFCSG